MSQNQARTELRFCDRVSCKLYSKLISYNLVESISCRSCGWPTILTSSPPNLHISEQSLRVCLTQSCDLYNKPIVYRLTETKCKLCGWETIPNERETLKSDKPLTFECKDIKGCPLVTSQPEVQIPFDLYSEWIFLCRQLDVEWIANLKGTTEKDGWLHYIDREGMYFNKQEVGEATAESTFLDQSKEEGTIGRIHSHVNMKAFFSGTDWDHFSSPVELVINRNGQMECVVRIKLRCGEFSRVEASIKLIPSEAQVKVLADLESKITIKPKSKNYSNKADILYTLNGELVCSHNISINRFCKACGRPDSPQPQDKRDSKGKKPTDAAVQMALRILDQRIQQADLRGLLDIQQAQTKP
jgi:hypothetical protein